jgi:ABC-type sugar transport system permease subunit
VWVGIDNFRFVLGDADFHRAVFNTVVFTLCSLCIQLPLALLLALLLAESRSRWAQVARLVLFSPQLTGQIFVGIMFSVLFMPRYGLVNQGLQGLLGWGLEREWLTTPGLVMPAIVLASLWMYVGFNMIYFLAALQNVDKSLEEAARIDGANRWQVFRHVTLPAIRPVTIFVVVTSTIGSLQLFELPFALLKGPGPNNSGLTIVGYLYNTAFGAGDLGTGAAVGWILAFLIFIIGLVQIRLSGQTKE